MQEIFLKFQMTTEEYLLKHIDEVPEYLKVIERRTWVQQLNPRMVSGALQGRLLAMLCAMIRPANILEIGTYTGYSALCLAENLAADGKLHTIEIDDELEDTIRENFALSPFSEKLILHIGEALKIIPSLNETFDLVFIDADKRDYLAYYDAVFPKIKPGGYILADNTLWDGKVLQPVSEKDTQTIEIMKFNDFITQDKRVKQVILPLRDGLTIIQKINDN